MKITKKINSGAGIIIKFIEKVKARLFPPDNSREIAKKRLAELNKTAIVKDVVSPIDEDWDAMK